MIRGFFYKFNRSFKNLKNVIFHVKLLSLTLIILPLNKTIFIRTLGPRKRVTFLTFSQEIFKYFSNLILTVLFCVKLIRKFFTNVKCSKVKSFLIEEILNISSACCCFVFFFLGEGVQSTI